MVKGRRARRRPTGNKREVHREMGGKGQAAFFGTVAFGVIEIIKECLFLIWKAECDFLWFQQ